MRAAVADAQKLSHARTRLAVAAFNCIVRPGDPKLMRDLSAAIDEIPQSAPAHVLDLRRAAVAFVAADPDSLTVAVHKELDRVLDTYCEAMRDPPSRKSLPPDQVRYWWID